MLEKLSRPQTVPIIVAIIGGICVCIAALIGWGNPIVEKWAEKQFRDTPTNTSSNFTNTSNPNLSGSEKIGTQTTDDNSENDPMTLEVGEIFVGHADKFLNFEGCVAFLVVGPGEFNFSVESGLWDKWRNVTPDLYDILLKEQSDTLVNKYSCTPVKIVKCDPECRLSEP